MQYVLCDVWCVMCDVPGLFFCKILTLWVKGRPKIPHLGSFRPFEWYSKTDRRWQSYVHFNLQGLLGQFFSDNPSDFQLFIPFSPRACVVYNIDDVFVPQLLSGPVVFQKFQVASQAVYNVHVHWQSTPLSLSIPFMTFVLRDGMGIGYYLITFFQNFKCLLDANGLLYVFCLLCFFTPDLGIPSRARKT